MTTVHMTLAYLVDRLDSDWLEGTEVIPWGSPIPVFGDLLESTVASLGLNPSRKEFVDDSGSELDGPERRFHTLTSLGISSWEEVNTRHLDLMVEACCSYFEWNPYDAWFKKLDIVVSATGGSFYERTACHLDLIPYATMRKWADLKAEQRSLLLASSGRALGTLLRDSQIRRLILNGSSVVELFEELAGVELDRRVMPAWSLRRQKASVDGVAYRGTIETLSGVHLDREVLVAGYNHNLQSSYGVTNAAVSSIRSWIAEVSDRVKH